jgi:hypothetical protein
MWTRQRGRRVCVCVCIYACVCLWVRVGEIERGRKWATWMYGVLYMAFLRPSLSLSVYTSLLAYLPLPSLSCSTRMYTRVCVCVCALVKEVITFADGADVECATWRQRVDPNRPKRVSPVLLPTPLRRPAGRSGTRGGTGSGRGRERGSGQRRNRKGPRVWAIHVWRIIVRIGVPRQQLAQRGRRLLPVTMHK